MMDRSVVDIPTQTFEDRRRTVFWRARRAAGLRVAVKAATVLAAAAVLIGFSSAPSLCKVVCKPVITVKSVQLSEPEGLQRLWSAVLQVDAGRCASSSGQFEIDFTRGKEMSLDLQFTESFRWTPGVTEVSVEMWIDETIQDFRIGFVAPCVCRDPPL